MGRASSFLCSKAALVILVAAGIFLSAVFVFAQTSDTASPAVHQEQVDAALVDLGDVYGQPITSVEQAKAICNLEQYLGDCAEIGKRHDLFEAEEIKSVDAVLSALKGKLIDDLKNCADETCLVGVASQLAKRLADKAPTVAQELDLTTKKVAEKNEIVKAAKEVGVNFDDCRTMDPDSASVELLRACAKLAKHQGVQKQLSADARQAVENQDASLQLQESLRSGAYQCGDNTVGGCGNYCLNPVAGSAIPPVCREIAQKFFGSGGVKQLELVHGQVQQTAVDYLQKAENVVFVTLDGQKLTSPDAIGRYMEEAGKTGNVEAVGKGMDFLVSKGFVKPEDKDFALRMVQKIKDQGGNFDFDQCSKNPETCGQFIHDKDRGKFAAQDQVHRIIGAEIEKNGVPNAQVCNTPQYSQICHEATRAVLPQLRQLAAQSPETQPLVAEIESRFVDANKSFETRRNVENKFLGGEQLKIGSRTFSNFGELEAFCRENSAVCLAETARQGFIDRDYASQKYEHSFEAQQGPFPGFIPPGQGGQPPGRTPGFTSPGPGFGLPSGISKEEALKKFEAWLDNPQGAPPIPNQQIYPDSGQQASQPFYQGQVCPQIYPRPCTEGQYRVDSRDNQGCFIPGECVPIPGYTSRRQESCPRPVEPACSAGQYSRFVRGLDGCYVGECVSGEQRPQLVGQTCPLSPTVTDCPAGEEKYVTYSSPDCGAYFGCRKSAQPLGIPASVASILPGAHKTWDQLGEMTYLGGDNNSFVVYNDNVEKIVKQGKCSTDPNPPFGCPNIASPGTGCGTYTTQESCVSHSCDWSGSICVAPSSVPVPVPVPVPLPKAQCSDGRDNDGDGQVDYPADTGCYGPIDNDETSASSPGNCPSGQWWDGATHSCTSSSSCGYGQYWDPTAQSCKTSTTGGTTCPSGKWWNGTACVNTAPTDCPSGQYWNGTACVISNTSPDTSCDSALINLLGSGCHQMYTDSTGSPVFCDGPMTKSARRGETATTSGCSQTSGPTVTPPPAGQKEQIWNSSGLKSWIRTDADSARIEQLKQACVSVSNGANIWSPNSGSSTSVDFGMPSADKCRIAATCSSSQYFDGAACVTSTTPPTSGSCTQELINLLGSGCHQMYSDSSGNLVFCDGPMTKSAKRGDTATTLGCSNSTSGGGTAYPGDSTSCPGFSYSRWDGQNKRYCQLNSERRCDYNYPSYLTNGANYKVENCPAETTTTPGPGCGTYTTSATCEANQSCDWFGSYCSPTTSGTTCPSGQWWDGATHSCTSSSSCGYGQYWDPATSSCKSSTTSSTSCPSGQYWSGNACVNSTTTTTSSSCPSFAHDMGGYCMLNGDASRCAEYSNAAADSGYTSAICQQRSGTITTPPSNTNTTCASGQWWDSATNSCKSTSSTTCPSGQYWSGSACVTTSTTDCTAGQYWNGSSCVNSTTPPSNSTTCPSGQYWSGNACVNSTTTTPPPPTNTTTTCPSGQYWSGTACVTATPPPTSMLTPQSCPGNHYWDGDSCVFGTKKNVLHFIAEIRTSFSGLMNWLGRLFTK